MYEKIKQATQDGLKEVDEAVKKQAYKKALAKLNEAGIDPEELSDEEMAQLVAEEVKEIRTFGKGAAVGAGALMVLNLLG